MITTGNCRLAVVFVVTLLLLSSVGPVGAQNARPSPGSGILDTNAEKIASMAIDGTSYTVYRIDTILPYMGGIEIYANGTEVTDEDRIEPVLSRLAARRTLSDVQTTVSPSSISSERTARSRFTVVAWEISAKQLSDSDIRRLRSISETASRIDRIVSPVLSAVNFQLEVFQEMKNTGLFGVTAWDVATNTYPSLSQYERGLQTLRTQLRELNEAVEGITENVEPAIDSVRSAQRGERVDYQQLSEQLRQASESLEQLQAKVDQVKSAFLTTKRGTDEAREALRSSDVPNEFIRPLGELSSRLGQASAELEAFSSELETSREQLSTVRQTAADKQQSLVSEWRTKRSKIRGQWRARQSVEVRIYSTLGGISVIGAVLLGRRVAWPSIS